MTRVARLEARLLQPGTMIVALEAWGTLAEFLDVIAVARPRFADRWGVIELEVRSGGTGYGVRIRPAIPGGVYHDASIARGDPQMASIHKEVSLSASPAAVWDVVRDVAAVHTRLAPGFVTDTVMDGPDRIVTFADGLVAREVIVDIDETRRRLAYSVRSERLSHHNASFQVFAEGAGSRLVWIADLLPDAAAVNVAARMEHGLVAAKRALDAVVTA
jgi:hypothetical protein